MATRLFAGRVKKNFYLITFCLIFLKKLNSAPELNSPHRYTLWRKHASFFIFLLLPSLSPPGSTESSSFRSVGEIFQNIRARDFLRLWFRFGLSNNWKKGSFCQRIFIINNILIIFSLLITFSKLLIIVYRFMLLIIF